ncbi:heterokaryon incompatibility protein-domain-containing protein [Chiua virens]|nr:heterokaryon incompatibility protein-domain-containing protein [Chiua virens]
MERSDRTPKLCQVCSKLDIQRLTHPIVPCRNPLPCSVPPIKDAFAQYLALGSIDEIKGRRSTCGVCSLIADSLDNEPSDLGGGCSVRESAEFATFMLPVDVQVRDPSVTHLHFTQTIVIFDTSEANRFPGPSLPWELKERDTRGPHNILSFQVKAKSSFKRGISQTEQEFLDTVGGRYVGPRVDTGLIRAWLDECEHKHGEDCMPYLGFLEENKEPAEEKAQESTFPKFVIDVKESCVVETPSQCRYVALSYVWGEAKVFTHLKENSQALRVRGALNKFPITATIRDAIVLVRSIEERYLWVDSICITQDDKAISEPEIKRMGTIYSKALFTLVVAAGNHANNGIPGVGERFRKDVQKVLKIDDYELLTVIDARETPSGIEKTTWAERGWTFQERILSNRVLVFSEDEVYWSCRLASHSEERALEQVRDIDRLHKPFPELYAATALSWETLSPFDYSQLYYDLLFKYRERQLTRQTDLINAFSGVSEILSKVQDDRFIWGLPESLFSYAMTWSFTGHTVRNEVEVTILRADKSKEDVPIPSWSWAAWSKAKPPAWSLPPFPVLDAGDSTHVRPVIQFEVVGDNCQLVRINERSWEDSSSDRGHETWKQATRSLEQPLRIGQLHFWTSFANVKAVQSQRVEGPGQVMYTLFPPPNFEPGAQSHYNTKVVDQDFIVIAAAGPKTLLLLAVEFKDGVAYRIGKTVVQEVDWIKVENREWKKIILG